MYIELNNWTCGVDYPDEEPFIRWMNDYQFCNEEWVKENGLIVVIHEVDMSLNFCITAPDGWIQGDYQKFIRIPEEGEEVPYGRFGCPFYSFREKEPGIYRMMLEEDDQGYTYYAPEEDSII